MKLALFFTIPILSFSSLGQSTDSLNNDMGNRLEGYASEQVGSKFEVIAFHRYRLNSYSKEDTLQLQFYVPQDNSEGSLTGRTIVRKKKKYRMTSKDKQWKKGWNSFGPWPVGDFLLNETRNSGDNILASDLGVLVEFADKIFSPVIISKGKGGNIISDYSLYFYTPTAIDEIVVSVLKGDNVVQEIIEKDFDATSSFLIKFDEPVEEGEYRVTYDITWKNVPLPFSGLFSFYHSDLK